MRAVASAIVVALILAAAPAHAEPRTDGERRGHGLAVVLGGSAYLALELGFKQAITADHCRWCARNRLDDRVRTAVRWDDVELADLLGNVTGYVGAPLVSVLGLTAASADQPELRRWFDDVVPVMQAGVAAGLVNQLVKVVAMRERPYAAHGGRPVQGAGDENVSFYSGHTTLAFATATAAGTVASLRGYRAAPLIWLGGGAFAVATGYLRMAADAHYLTDVAVGAIAGAAIGVLVPWLLHRDVLRGDGDGTARAGTADDAAPLGLSFGGAF
ncbi:MAG: phosphatase PAP2 family protein [Kofleriaceae bacterium]